MTERGGQPAWSQDGAFEQRVRPIRQLIWVYLILWLLEGALRRWVLPGLSTPLLLVRDPVVVAIYWLAITRNVFPTSAFITFGALLGATAFFNAILLGHGNAMVALYGTRCDFLDIPLIFIMGKVLRQKDLINLAKVAVYIVVPYTALLAAQFYEPQDSWINRGVGDGSVSAGFSGALGRFRPPGTFTFITGPAELYPLITACWFLLIQENEMPGWLALVSGGAILIAMPVSISRLLFVNVGIVAMAGIAALVIGRRFSGGMFFRIILIALLMPLLAAQIPAFEDGMEAFSARWQNSTTSQGGIEGSIIDRVLGDLFGAFDEANIEGLGSGFSTNVGQTILTGDVGFGASEGEWGRLLYDNGLILGSMLILYRTLLTGYLVWCSLKAMQRRSPQALVFVLGGFLLILQGQWGQASTQGAAAIFGGLTLAAIARPHREALDSIKSTTNTRLRRRLQRLSNATA